MKAVAIFSHSVRLVLRNIEDALRVSLLLYLVQVAFNLFLHFNPPVLPNPETGALPVGADGGTITATFFLSIAALLASLWIAVAWHRFVLAEDYPKGWLPDWRGSEVLSYLGRSIMVGLFCAAGAMVALVPVSMLVVAMPGLALLINAVILGVVAYLFFRLGVMLPAAAIGRKLTLRETWNATANDSQTIFALTAIVIVASLVLRLPSLLNGDPNSMITLVYESVVNWFATIIGISVLTTLFGHYVEGRAIE